MVEEQTGELARRVGVLEGLCEGLRAQVNRLEERMDTGFRELRTEVRWLSFGLAVLIGALGVWG